MPSLASSSFGIMLAILLSACLKCVSYIGTIQIQGDLVDNQPAITKEELLNTLSEEFPQVFDKHKIFDIEHVGYGDVRFRLHTQEKHLRPGGTVSGPTMMMLADCTSYVSVLSVLGKVLLAVTTNLNINFLRKPPKGDLICEAQPLKVGKSLMVIETTLYGADDPDKKTVAHATMTYSIPPKRD